MDFDRQILIMDLEAEFNEIQEKHTSSWKPPEWWYIGLGFKQAESFRQYNIAKSIYDGFLKFKGCKKDMTFRELIEAYSLAKVQNLL